MNPILVTGARGFVGTHVVERARTRGLAVETATGDLRRRDVVQSLVERVRPSAVVHLAETKNPDPGSALPDNLLMNANVLAAVAEAAPDAPVLLAGSAAQYGVAAPRLLTETDPTAPVSMYGAAKCVLEAAATLEPLRPRVRVIWARSFNHLGPGQGQEAPVASWARQIAVAEESGSGVLATGRLDVVRDFLDVRDVADAYLELVSAPFEGVVNVCSGIPCALEEIVGRMTRMSDASIPVKVDPELLRASDPPYVVGDPGRLRELTGWEPRYSLDDSLEDVLEEWRTRMRAPAGKEA